MKTETLSSAQTTTDTNEESPRTVSSATTQRLRSNAHPPNTVDRLAMRVGLALILWSRHHTRSRANRDEEWALAAHHNSLERQRREREQDWLAAVDSLARR